MKTSGKETLVTVVKTLAIPFISWLVMELLARSFAGMSVINSSADIKTLFRNLISSLAFALAISSNLNCGRMDLSLGSQMYVGVIFGGNLALALNLGGVGVLLMSSIIGGICGLVVGFVFINLRILPMVLGLGMTLVFECICFAVNKQQGVILFGKPGMELLSNISFIVVMTFVIILVTYYLYQLSRYGFHYRAIQGSQKLAADSGINIFSNCVISYVIAGVLVALAGVFITVYSGGLAPVLGMSSNSYVFSNMFPMVLGAWIGSMCHNRELGVGLAAVSVNIVILGLSKLGVSNSVQNVVVYSLFLLLVVYNANKHKIAYYKARRARAAMAQKRMAEKAAATA